ncbi:26S proteasome regulatory subunit-like protein [Hirsutella rhossiliensis]|uniref:26S proteasome regulatory subunit-like protein n=1 Tax=Hirsutella rhossiliensis TaxID=111463 RepID=A0A9P8N7E6_9HYPO|nr:26S proteasome regulatory subunit-like protein [Hirsutella rhossiliensis]KAH0968340.1 26S proteasome regulatory subunit-like protein [Hirsutella rhossiliensis]
MITFFPPSDAYEPFSREHAERLPDQQRRHQQQQIQDFGLPLDCLRICAALDHPRSLHFPIALNTSSDNSNSASDANLLSLQAMHPDSWGSVSHLTPKQARLSHQRQSSLSSSLGSAGPASPFAGQMSNPQIAVTDPAVDGFADMHPHDVSGPQASAFYQFPKPINSYLGCNNLEAPIPDKMAYPVTIPGPTQRPRADRSLLPAPDFASSCNRSRPASVASSAAGDSPATPNAGESDQVDRRRTEYCNVPKLDRTMTDVYGDELYSPNFAITSTSPSQSQTLTSPTNDIFSQRINAANSQHLNAAHSPSSTASRTRSPFRTGSPFVSSTASHATLAVYNNTMRRAREGAKAQQAASSTHQQGDGSLRTDAEVETPKTISPKDAMLEFGEADGNANFPLFPQDASTFVMEPTPKGASADGPESDDPYMESSDYHGTGAPATATAGFQPTQMSPNIPAPQQYPFDSEARVVQHTPPRLSPSGSSSIASSSTTPTSVQRPPGTGADGGTYTCTYHGCTLRFETPLLLQKHKREGHRQTQGLGGPREASISSGMLNTQSGPHRCDRINPSTGKSCDTVFSRPYDLTRHEDTIHNARKQKVRCDMCTEEKTFSRADALTRHYRVCHPEVELPGKHKRQGST